MTRYITCRKCGEPFTLHPEDRGEGFEMRKSLISCARVPKVGHEIRIQVEGEPDEVIPVDEVVCDLCSEGLTGQEAVAITIYRGKEPPIWEQEFIQGNETLTPL